MTEFTFTESDDFDPPSYKDVGRVLVEVIEPGQRNIYRWKCEFHEYDGSAYIINEGITGHYTRGDGWEIDDDEDWEYDSIRPATATEIATQCFDD